MTSYIALIRKEAASDYGVEFPDLPGCVTAGTDLDDARRMASEALALHIQGLVEDGDEVPNPSTLETVMQDQENQGAVAILVEAPLRVSTAVRVNITLPQDLLAAIDRASPNRSRFLADAARVALRERAFDPAEIKVSVWPSPDEYGPNRAAPRRLLR